MFDIGTFDELTFDKTTFEGFSASALAIAAPSLGAPAFGQLDSLTATPLVAAAPTLVSSALIKVLVASALSDAVPTFGASSLVTVLAAAPSFADSSPLLGVGTFGQLDHLTATSLAASASTLAATTLNQMDVLIPSALLGSSSALSAPTFNQADVIAPANLLASAPALDSPALNQADILSPGGLADIAPLFDVELIGQADVLAAAPLIDGVPAEGAPVFGQFHVLHKADLTLSFISSAPLLAQNNVLLPAGLADSAPSSTAPILNTSDPLSIAIPLHDSAPSLGAPALGQHYFNLAASRLVVHAPDVAINTLHQRQHITAAALVDHAPTFTLPIWKDILTEVPLFNAAPILASPVLTQTYPPPVVSFAADAQVDADGNPLQQALFSNLNDQSTIIISGGTLIGRSRSQGRGPAQAVDVVPPLQFVDGPFGLQLSIDFDLLRKILAEWPVAFVTVGSPTLGRPTLTLH